MKTNRSIAFAKRSERSQSKESTSTTVEVLSKGSEGLREYRKIERRLEVSCIVIGRDNN